MKFEKIIGKRIILYTKKNFRFQGQVKDFDGQFLEIFDELKQKPKMINVNEITEFEVDQPTATTPAQDNDKENDNDDDRHWK